MNFSPKALISFLWLLATVDAAEAQTLVFAQNGDSAGDRFGTSVAGCGDVNGDGVPDFVVGIPYDDLAGINSGTVRVYSGADGEPLHEFLGGAAGDMFGISVAGAGDVNRDGFQDVIIGAPGSGSRSGQARVHSGADGSLLHVFNGQAPSSEFGTSVSTAGDIDLDSHADVLIGAVGAGGSAWVFSGRTGQVLATLTGDDPLDHFGASVHGGGDINGDGWPDYVVGAPRDDDLAIQGGTATVFSGRDHSVLWVRNGTFQNGGLGASVAILGDLDGDAKEEFGVGVPGASSTFQGAGKAVVYSGASGEVLWEQSGARFHAGLSLRGPAGDVDGDGVPDVLLGAPRADLTNTGSGTVRVVSGVDGSLLTFLRGTSVDGSFGYAAWSVGDLTGDGLAEVVIGDPGHPLFLGNDPGRALVVNVFRDCNANGVHDGLEVLQGSATDCDGDLVLDSCALVSGMSPDCNGNGVPDSCDVAEGTLPDCNRNGIPDECDIASAPDTDCNANGIPDPCEVPRQTFQATERFEPLEGNTDAVLTLLGPPDPFGDVILEFSAYGWLIGQNRVVAVSLNGGIVGQVFASASGASCDAHADSLLITKEQYDELVAGGDAVFSFEPSNSVSTCSGSFLEVTVRYPFHEPSDCNGNGTDDVLDVLCGGAADANANGIPDECEFENYCAAAPNSTGSAATMTWTGSNCVSDNDLVLLAFPLPPVQNGLFVYSPDQGYTPLGNGFLCLGNQTQGFINRLPFETSNGSGTMVHELDLTAPPVPGSLITAGSTWNFQCWFRDVPAGGAGFNFSDGLRVLFCP